MDAAPVFAIFGDAPEQAPIEDLKILVAARKRRPYSWPDRHRFRATVRRARVSAETAPRVMIVSDVYEHQAPALDRMIAEAQT